MRISDWSSDVCSSDLDFVARTADSVHRMVSDPSSPPKELTMETGQYLVLSTAHIRCATGQILTAWADYPPHKQPLPVAPTQYGWRSEEHTSELQSLMRISYAVFCLKKKKTSR